MKKPAKCPSRRKKKLCMRHSREAHKGVSPIATEARDGITTAYELALPRRLPSSFGVLENEKSMGLGGGAAVSPYTALRSCCAEAALKAALTSWPSEAFVRMERRWRGLNVDDGIVMWGGLVWFGLVLVDGDWCLDWEGWGLG